MLYGTCFVVGLMGFTSYKMFYAADKEEREQQARRQAGAPRIAPATAGGRLGWRGPLPPTGGGGAAAGDAALWWAGGI